MNKRIKVKKSLVAKYIAKARVLTATPGIYAYRGQENETWPVESSASRRIRNVLENPPDIETFISYHENELLTPARMDGYGGKNGRELGDLELLADLQHFGAATCMIDFTRNFLVALWFACKNFEGAKKHDGKVFILNINDPAIFLSVDQPDLEQSIRSIIYMEKRFSGNDTSNLENQPRPAYWHWSPHGMNQRILKQDSVFVFGKIDVSSRHLKFIKVRNQDKSGLLDELKDLGVSRESLFKDLPGFASVHGHEGLISMRSVSAEGFFLAGNSAFQKGEMEKAIQLYDEADSGGEFSNPELLVARGSAYHILKEYDPAIKDFNTAVELDSNNANAYLFRGFTYFSMEEYDAAIGDFTKAEEFESTKYSAYRYRGHAYLITKKYDAAIEDFTKAITHDPRHTHARVSYFHRGLAYSALEEHENAIEDYTQAIELDPTDPRPYYNRGCEYDYIQQYNAAVKDFTKTVELDPTNSDAYFNRGRVYAVMGTYNAAADSFTNTIEHDPEMAIAYYARSLSYRELGRVGESKTSLARALELAEQQKDDNLVQQIQNVLNHLNEDNQGV